MTAGTYDISVEQNATFSLTITWKNSAGSPIDLTGYTAKAVIQSQAGATLATLSSAGGVDGTITLGGAAGTIVLTLPAAFTAGLTPQIGMWDLLLTSGSTKTRLLQGSVGISRGVTT